MKIARKLLEEIAEAQFKAQSFYEEAPARPIVRPPASAKELAALNEYLRGRGLAFPPAYREFLSIANGLSDFSLHLSLSSVEEVMQPPHPNIQRLHPSLSRFLIGTADSLEFIAFDPDTAKKDGEMEVVWVADNGEEARYADLGQLLNEYLEGLREAIESLEADRKGLKD